jgi:hypothetical protein
MLSVLNYGRQWHCTARKLSTAGKVMVKVTLQQATKAQRGVKVYLYSAFKFGDRWMGGQRHVPAALPLRKTRYPLNRKMGGPQGRSGDVENFAHTGI